MSIVPILTYHDIDEPAPDDAWAVLCVRPVTFRRQVAILRALGYRLVTMSEALPVLAGKQQARIAVITFDDAYADVFENALPILLEAGARATVYAVSACVGGHNAWDADQGRPARPTMGAAQLRAWRAAGMEVGAHTRTHPHLPGLAPAALEEEIRGGKEEIEQLLGTRVDHFCYPYGDVDGAAIRAVAAAGFRSAVTTRRGRARPGDDPLSLPRISVKGHLALPLFPFRVITAYEDRRGRSAPR